MSDKETKSPSGPAGYSPPLLRPGGWLGWCALVLMNLFLLGAAGLFWQYLHSGRWFDFSARAFGRDLTTPLGTVLLGPLDIFSYPWMILIAGLALAVLIVIPLATAVMYQLLLSLVFVAVVAVVAHSPMLALALAAGCLVAGRTKLRRDYPMVALLLGLVPVCLFLYLLAYPGIDATMLLPLQRWILALPFFLAILLAIMAGGVAVILATAGRLRSGVIWPGAGIIILASAGLFYWQIGPAELHYAILTKTVSPGDAIFAPVPREAWIKIHGEGLGEQALTLRINDDLEARRARLASHCEEFLRQYPKSPRAPSVAWLRAQCESLQLDARGLDSGLISYTAAFVQRKSTDAWESLLEKYPTSRPAALARWHLGVLQLRLAASGPGPSALAWAKLARGTLRQAQQELREVVADLRDEDTAAGGAVFGRSALLPGKQNYENALFAVECLNWTIDRNDVLTDARCAQALARLTGANPYRHQYDAEIKALATAPDYAQTKMADNLQIAQAKLHRNVYDRAEALKAIAADQRTDAAIEAFYELGRISMQTASARVIRLLLNRPEEYFKIVIAAPRNPWQGRAAENLLWLGSTAPAEQKP